MNKTLKMFLSFLKIGAFTFGGGYAMIPIMQEEMVNKNKWIDENEFMDILVVAQSFPGAMAVNTSIFIGYKISGKKGAVAALLGTILPSFAIILFIASFFMQFRDNHIVSLVFKGIGAAVPVMVLSAITSLSKSVKKNYVNMLIIVLVMLSISFLHLNPAIAILLAGLYGFVFFRRTVE